MRKIVDYALWIGNAADLRDASLIMAAGIEAVVELADSEQLAVLPRDLIRLRFPLSDGGDNPAWLLRFTIDSIAALLRVSVPVLVCCSAGMSRSVCASACAIAFVDGCPLPDTLTKVVGCGPVDVSPVLLSQFQSALKEQALS